MALRSALPAGAGEHVLRRAHDAGPEASPTDATYLTKRMFDSQGPIDQLTMKVTSWFLGRSAYRLATTTGLRTNGPNGLRERGGTVGTR